MTKKLRNSHRYLLQTLVFSAAGGLLCPLPGSATSTYNFQTLNNQTDPTFNQLLGINNAGVIAGYYGVGSATNPNKGYTLAPPYGQASYTNENFPLSAQTQVVGINSNSSPTTVGFWVDNAGNNFGFVQQGDTFTSVSDPNTPAAMGFNQLLGINNNNVAVGFYVDGNGDAQAYSYNIGSKTFGTVTLPSTLNPVMTTATGINNAAVISGFYVDGAGNIHGFLDNGGTFSIFDDPAGAGMNTSFLGLNNEGEVVGSYVDQAGITNGFTFNYLTNTWTTVDDPNASPMAAFDVTGTTINGVNDQGQIVGFYSDGNNVDGFMATPVPEPTSFACMAAGLLLCTWVSRRKRTDVSKMDRSWRKHRSKSPCHP